MCVYIQTKYSILSLVIYSKLQVIESGILSFLPVKDNIKEFRPCGIINPNSFWYTILIKKIMNKLYRERQGEG